MNLLKLTDNEVVLFKGEKFKISKVLSNMTHAIVSHYLTGKVETAAIVDLMPILDDNETPEVYRPLDTYTAKELEKARLRFEIIKPLTTEYKGDRQKLIEVAATKNVGVSTLYKWIVAYESTGSIGSLVEREGRGGKGKYRIGSEVEKIIELVVEKTYKKAAKSITYTINEIESLCHDANLKAPHHNTVRARISKIDEQTKTKFRRGPRAASEQFDPATGKFPGADYPLSVVQIDHTQLDVMLVDEIDREPLARPWFTVCIDINSRVPLGFYLSFDPPGAYGTGRAIVNSLMAKESYLASLGISGEWPCWGKMNVLHADNAREFRGNMLRQVCLDYGMNLEFRPVKKPNYGGHIERLMGTFNAEIHDLDGAIRSNRELRNFFKPEKTASMTLHDLEKWLVIYITEVYMKRIHTALDLSPLQKWKEGIFGSGKQAGIGVPERYTDESRLRLDFMPLIKRTVQRSGVSINNIDYYGDVLRKWINAFDKKISSKTKLKRKFIFKQDPRDISKVYFLDPDLKMYYEIPYLNISGPKMSKWEYNKIVNKLKEDRKPIDEVNIFKGYKRMREFEDEARKKTKSTRKRNEREAGMKRENKVDAKPAQPKLADTFFEDEDIKPFDQIEHATFK